MKHSLPLFFILVILLSAFSGNHKKAGYYYQDELLKSLPGFQKSIDSATAYCKEARVYLEKINAELAQRTAELQSPDTAKWNRAVLALKKKDVAALKERRSGFLDAIILDSIQIIQKMQRPLEKKIDSAAAQVKTANHLDTIFDRKNQILFEALTKEHAKIRDVNDKMKMALGLK